MILDGKKTAEKIKEGLKEEMAELKKMEIIPGLAVILVGNDPASQIYVASKEKACRELGINSQVFRLEKKTSEKSIIELIKRLNSDGNIHGILVQLPLPKYIDEFKIISAIDPKKDVDCFHPENLGKVVIGKALFYPCTPLGIMELLAKYDIEISGKDVTIIGMSNIVGKPLANMLINAGATVVACQQKTGNLKEKTLSADILVTAVGKPGLIKADMVKKDVILVDVGMSRDVSGKLRGDADFSELKTKVAAITPVPGGVGPMTVAILMKNTVQAAKNLCA